MPEGRDTGVETREGTERAAEEQALMIQGPFVTQGPRDPLQGVGGTIPGGDRWEHSLGLCCSRLA